MKDKATVQSLVDAEREKFKLGVQTNLSAELKLAKALNASSHIFLAMT